MLTKLESRVNLKHNWLMAGGKYFLHPNHHRGLLRKVQMIVSETMFATSFQWKSLTSTSSCVSSMQNGRIKLRAKVDQLISQPNKPPVPNSPCCNSFLRCSSKGSGLFIILRRRLIITRNNLNEKRNKIQGLD
jgi:hypothetical protein